MFMPLEGSKRVWLIDESHKLTNEAQNALLKILEDTPPHVYFVLCTTDPQKLLRTIQSRCTIFQLYPLTEQQMYTLLRGIVHAEREQLDKTVYDQIFVSSRGLPRTAIQILEQVLKVPVEERLVAAQKMELIQTQSIELCRALIQQGSWREVREILKGLKNEEPEDVRRHVLGYCQSVLLNGENDTAGRVMEEFLEPTYNTGFPGIVYACYAIIKS